MRVLLATFGTRGDVQPLLALASALRGRGHQALLAAPPDFAALAATAGCDFEPVGSPFREFLAAANQRPRAAAVNLQKEIGTHFRALWALVQRWPPDVVIGAASQLAAASIAERLGVPYRYQVVSPQALPSRHHPPPYVPWPGLPRAANVAAWGTVRLVFNALGRRTLNRLRAELELPPIRDVLAYTLPQNGIVTADPSLAPLPVDLRPHAFQCPALIASEAGALDPEIEGFLSAGPPPIYAGFGSMGDATPARTTGLLLQAARTVGVRLVLASGWAELGDGAGRDGVLVVREPSHAALFPRVSAVIHHGGSGTTHAAARAGVPQVIVPHMLDQPYWAMRLRALGVAPPAIPRPKLTAARLVEALQFVARPEVRQRARELGPTLRSDGARQAAVFLEGLASP